MASYLDPFEKFKGPPVKIGGDTIIEGPNEEEKIGDGINGGKPVPEVIGNGEVNGTVVGDTLGEAVMRKFTSNYCSIITVCTHRYSS